MAFSPVFTKNLPEKASYMSSQGGAGEGKSWDYNLYLSEYITK
jgi:hypothetical protein